MLKIPFAEVKASKDFMTEVHQLLLKEFVQANSKFISKNNLQTFTHGKSWGFQQKGDDGYSTQTGEMELQKQEVSIGIDRLMMNDLTVLPEFILKFSDQMSSSIQAGMVKEMQAIAEKTGNTISVDRGMSMADAFLEAINRMDWSVDTDGKACPPSIMLDRNDQARLEKEVEERGSTFKEQIEDIKRKKEAAALRIEEERLQRFNSFE